MTNTVRANNEVTIVTTPDGLWLESHVVHEQSMRFFIEVFERRDGALEWSHVESFLPASDAAHRWRDRWEGIPRVSQPIPELPDPVVPEEIRSLQYVRQSRHPFAEGPARRPSMRWGSRLQGFPEEWWSSFRAIRLLRRK